MPETLDDPAWGPVNTELLARAQQTLADSEAAAEANDAQGLMRKMLRVVKRARARTTALRRRI